MVKRTGSDCRMELGFDLKLEQTQKLIMTQELRQAIQLLQFNSFELNQYLKNEIEENPMLELESGLEEMEMVKELPNEREVDWKEFIEKYDDVSYKPQVDKNQEEYSYESFISYEPTLKEYLLDQLNLVKIDEKKYIIAEYIIQSIDENGYLKSTVEEIAYLLGASLAQVEEALRLVQSFEPTGVGARDLKECLLIQVRERGKEPFVERIIKDYLEDLGYNRIIKISKELDVNINKVQKACDYIKTLEPKPGRTFGHGSANRVRYIIPDATIEFIEGELLIRINDITGPRLNINSFYKNLIRNSSDEATEFLSERLNSALWIIKSIEQRRQTIYKVVESIVKFQRKFFTSGEKALVPLTLKDVAEDIDMHESTVSRATNGKYVQTPKGLFELKYFFSSSIGGTDGDQSSIGIKMMIKNLIEEEDPKKPLSDQKITDLLNEKGTNISRRTVAKYRNEMEIPSSTRRRRFV